MTRPLSADCAYCIDGYMPNGISPTIGPLYTTCKRCEFADLLPMCPGCNGISSFPADFTCLHCLSEHVAAQGWAAVLCAVCGGVTELIPADSIPPEDAP